MSIDLQKYMDTVSRKLCGPINERMSKPEELRFGTNGSMAIDLKAGTFYDHENGAGGLNQGNEQTTIDRKQSNS